MDNSGIRRTLNIWVSDQFWCAEDLSRLALAPVPTPDAGPTSAHAVSLRDATRQFEREFIADALARHAGRKAPTAKDLGIKRPNLYRKMRALGLS